MAEIVLTTLNARYIHSAMGLRCLLANLGNLRQRAEIAEFTIKQAPEEIAESILSQDPRIVGIGVYIWNVKPVTQLVNILKERSPNLAVVLGGPEVSHYPGSHPLVEACDYVIKGEGEVSFAELCGAILSDSAPATRLIHGRMPDLKTKVLPYAFYSDEDIKNRVIYVEASRGCPFECEFCLSALDERVRNIPLEHFLEAMQNLFDRGVRHFKFVDRTFNLNIRISQAILCFFLERYEPGLFVHFEMIPDRLPPGLRDIIARFPAGALQFEIGIQTFNEDVSSLISRKQDAAKVVENLQFLTQQTGVHIHADLIVGLPGESLQSFAHGFDELVELGPHEIQVGILKRLPGAPISRHDQSQQMVYNPAPPYDIRENSNLSAATITQLKRFAQFWDKIANSGNFRETTPMLWRNQSPFSAFLKCSDWLFDRFGATHGIGLEQLVEALLEYSTEHSSLDGDEVGRALLRDYTRSGRRTPRCLYRFGSRRSKLETSTNSPTIPARQRRHLTPI